jgi:hypothetical protein
MGSATVGLGIVCVCRGVQAVVLEGQFVVDDHGQTVHPPEVLNYVGDCLLEIQRVSPHNFPLV